MSRKQAFIIFWRAFLKLHYQARYRGLLSKDHDKNKSNFNFEKVPLIEQPNPFVILIMDLYLTKETNFQPERLYRITQQITAGRVWLMMLISIQIKKLAWSWLKVGQTAFSMLKTHYFKNISLCSSKLTDFIKSTFSLWGKICKNFWKLS